MMAFLREVAKKMNEKQECKTNQKDYFCNDRGICVEICVSREKKNTDEAPSEQIRKSL